MQKLSLPCTVVLTIHFEFHRPMKCKNIQTNIYIYIYNLGSDQHIFSVHLEIRIFFIGFLFVGVKNGQYLLSRFHHL